MMRYAPCSKILEDTRTLRVYGGGTVISELLRRIRRSLAGVLHFKKVAGKMFLERLTRRSEGLIMRDDKGGVCFVGDFYKKIRKEFKIPSFCPLIISTKGGHDDQ